MTSPFFGLSETWSTFEWETWVLDSFLLSLYSYPYLYYNICDIYDNIS